MLAMLVLLPKDEVRFTKAVLDTRFVSEGVAVADVDRDGKLDVMAGNAWYRAPAWEKREIAPFVFVEPKTAWSSSFHNWAEDVNKDGWVDQIVIGMPGEKALWRENPGFPLTPQRGEGEKPWKEHLIWHSAGNESPLFVDLFNSGKRVLLMGYDDERLAWFEPASDPYAPWVCHDISEAKGAGSQRYSHGLGVGDIDGDGNNDVLTRSGFYWSDKNGWNFVPAEFGPDCAHMHVFSNGVLSTSAHARGVWWHVRHRDGFTRVVIDETISVTHSAVLTTFNGRPNLVTGKRKWGHPPGVDVGSEEAHWLVRYEFADGKWTRHMIDEDSGVGTQFEVVDVDGDGKLDIVTANKNGVFLFQQHK